MGSPIQKPKLRKGKASSSNQLIILLLPSDILEARDTTDLHDDELRASGFPSTRTLEPTATTFT